ncbi:MAG: small multi-drug export protein [Methanoregulaceae archaeon]|nr:small multi-drug export protein [Methanoregulaceae archaeon]
MSVRDLSWLASGKQGIPKSSLYLRLLIPPLLAVIFFLICILILPQDKILILGGLMLAYYVPPAGKESIIPIGIGLGIPWWLMAITVTLLDVITSLFMIMNFVLMLRVPKLGPWIEKTTTTGREFMAEHPWMARWRIPGVAFFVMLPLQGTGGVGATVVGLMAGLTPGEILFAVAVGAAIESLVFALGSELIWRLIMTNLVLGIGVFIGVIIAIILIYIHINRQMAGKNRQGKEEF